MHVSSSIYIKFLSLFYTLSCYSLCESFKSLTILCILGCSVFEHKNIVCCLGNTITNQCSRVLLSLEFPCSCSQPSHVYLIDDGLELW